MVDNNSTDNTAAVAKEKGAVVVHEPVRQIAKARNVGGRYASGDFLFLSMQIQSYLLNTSSRR